MTDEFGNLLASDIGESDDIVEAVYYIDELIAEQIDMWSEALDKGRKMIKDGKYREAAQVLQVFAFATGSEEAAEGKKLFDIVAREAAAELEKIAAGAGGELDAKAKSELTASLTKFIARWPKTPAAFAADDRIAKLASQKKPQ
jgi:hypothetical protein